MRIALLIVLWYNYKIDGVLVLEQQNQRSTFMNIYELRIKTHIKQITLICLIFVSFFISLTSHAQTPLPLPVVSLRLDHAEIKSGETATLNWSSSGANRCSASGGWYGYQDTSGSITIQSRYSSTYKLTCWNADGKSNSDSVALTIIPIPYPTVTFTASSTSIKRGDSTLIKWSSTNADYCTASGGWSGNWQPTGAVSVSPTNSTSYTITCVNSVYKVSKNLYIYIRGVSSTDTDITSPIDIVITAIPQTILKGQNTKLSWGATNVSSCYASGAWTGSKLPYDTQIVSPNTSSVYAITCTKGTEVKTASVLIIVSDTLPATTTSNAYLPTLLFYANPSTLTSRGTTVLNWQSNNTNYCIANGGWLGYKTTNGTENILINSQKNFTLTCYGLSGSSVYAEALVSLSYSYNWINPYTHTYTPTPSPRYESTPSQSFNVSCGVSTASALVGEEVSWSAVASGGTTPYSYIWSGAFSKIGADNSFAFTSTGTKTAMITVSDKLGRVARATCSTLIKPRAIKTAAPTFLSRPKPTTTNIATPTQTNSLVGKPTTTPSQISSSTPIRNNNNPNIQDTKPATSTLLFDEKGGLSGFGLLLIVYFLVLLFIAFAVLVYRFLKAK